VQLPPRQTDAGLRAAIEIRHSHPEVGALVLSQVGDEAYAMDLVGVPRESAICSETEVADLDLFA
jgi:hypothetical protein